MLRIYLPSSTDLKLCSNIPTVNFVDTWTFVTVFTSRYLNINNGYYQEENFRPHHDVQFELKTHKKSCPNQVLISHFLPYRLVRHHLWTNNPLCKSKKPSWVSRNSRFVVKTFAWACLKVRKSQDSARFGQPLLPGTAPHID